MARTQQTTKAKNDPKNKKRKNDEEEEEEEEEEEKKPSRPKRGAKAAEKPKKTKAEAKSASKAKGKRKKNADKDEDEEEEEKNKDDKNGKRSRSKDQDEEAEKAAGEPKGRKRAKIDLSDITMGVDEYFPKKNNVKVYNTGRKIYDNKLLQDSLDDVLGKFYYLQILQSKSKPDDFYFYTRWGRDFTKGQNKTVGPISEEEAIKEYKKKLDEKTKKEKYYIQA